MANRRVQVWSIEVFRDGDPSGKGEICWNINVGDAKVSERLRTNAVKAGHDDSLYRPW